MVDFQCNTAGCFADLTRQYKLMQSQLTARIAELQERERVLQDQLGKDAGGRRSRAEIVDSMSHRHSSLIWLADTTKQSLTETKTQSEKALREKNDMIAQLSQRIQSMETSYESVLNVSRQSLSRHVRPLAQDLKILRLILIENSGTHTCNSSTGRLGRHGLALGGCPGQVGD